LQLEGIHHVTAVTGHAAENVRFYTETLGLRLVKKTVNQDDVSAYHLFYGDALGHAGTEVTFFDWPRIGSNVPGAGSISATGLRVPGDGALEWWVRRFDERGVPHEPPVERAGRLSVAFVDPEGQHLELFDDGGVPGGTPWTGSPVPPEVAIRGLHAVTLVVDSLGPTERTLTEILGFRHAGEYPFPENPSRRAVVFSTGAGGPGAEVSVEVRPNDPPSRLGIGGVHHVAFRTPDETEQRRWRDRVAAAGLAPTPVIDRYYFKSVYFREPGGVLFEIATDGPGFATDEDAAHLGERLSLPPFLEPYRGRIEAGLRPIK
jgi:glyoxalase family protein